MPRNFYINGESMITVVGPPTSAIATATQLGLAPDPIRVTLIEHSKPLIVDAYGQDNIVDEQVFGGDALINMTLVHFDPVILAECVRLAWPSSTAEGQLGRAGTRRGNGVAPQTAGSSMINLNISSPVAGLPYNFPTTWLADHPVMIPLGTEKSLVQLIWKANAYAVDPWGAVTPGFGSLGAILYNRTQLNPPDNHP